MKIENLVVVLAVLVAAFYFLFMRKGMTAPAAAPRATAAVQPWYGPIIGAFGSAGAKVLGGYLGGAAAENNFVQSPPLTLEPSGSGGLADFNVAAGD